MNLLLVLPYHTKDAALLKKSLAWMAELQPCYKPHSCLLVADFAVPHDDKLAMQALAKPLFEQTETIIVRVPEDKQKWPTGANLMFAAAARQVAESYKLPWLWFEPDAVPIKEFWLDKLAGAYWESPKRLLGSLIPSNGEADLPPVHLAGCAIYPPNATDLIQFTSGAKAFDIAAAGYTVPRALNCPLMQHFWGKPDLAPKFKETPTAIDPPNVLTLDFLKSEAVTFHRCKDGSLIDLLRQRANSQPVKPVDQTPEPVPAQTDPATAFNEL